MVWRIGVDIGGTFTDVALVDEASGEIGVAKVPTTPQRPRRGRAGRAGDGDARYRVAATEVGLLSHATTVVTNAILEEQGRARRAGHDARLSRRAGAAAIGARDLYDLFQDAPAR